MAKPKIELFDNSNCVYEYIFSCEKVNIGQTWFVKPTKHC
jgi:hypothetical protein